jgi:hypothetical protein
MTTKRPPSDGCSSFGQQLTALRLLVLVGLLFQLSTLLLVIAGPVPPRLQAVSINSPFPPVAGVAASGAQPMSPSSDR